MDNTKLVLYLAVQSAIAIAAGEVTIRYFSWYLSIFRKGVALANLVLGVAMGASGLCAMEVERLFSEYQLAEMHLPIHAPVNFVEAVSVRFWIFIAACFLTVPVLVLQGGNRHDRRSMLTDMLIRLFIIIAAFAAGVNTAYIYYTVHGW